MFRDPRPEAEEAASSAAEVKDRDPLHGANLQAAGGGEPPSAL
jgi:hypothetical protein